MHIKASNFLKKALGEDIFESLSKTELWKPGTRTVVDPEEIAIALRIVPRTVMSILIGELANIAVGEHRDISLPFGKDTLLKVDKHERDVYSGHLEEDNKIVVDFKYRSLPGIGLVIMSAFELYDTDQLNHQKETYACSDIEERVQKLIDERLRLQELVNKVVDRKILQKEAVQSLILAKLTESLAEKQEKITQLVKISKESVPMDEPYFRGMANGMAVADAVINNKEAEFVNEPKNKKVSPIKKFLESRKKKNEFSIELSKGEKVHCPDCNKNIFDGKLFSGCICLGDDMERKVFIKKTEDSYNVRFSKGWDPDNIEMLLEVLRKKNG